MHTVRKTERWSFHMCIIFFNIYFLMRPQWSTQRICSSVTFFSRSGLEWSNLPCLGKSRTARQIRQRYGSSDIPAMQLWDFLHFQSGDLFCPSPVPGQVLRRIFLKYSQIKTLWYHRTMNISGSEDSFPSKLYCNVPTCLGTKNDTFLKFKFGVWNVSWTLDCMLSCS